VSGEILPALERFVLPNACVSCERPVETRAPDALVCGVCRGRMRPLPTGCHRCRQPLPAVGACRFCAAWPATLRWVRSAVWLGPEARALVHHLKYDGYPALAELAAERIVRTIPRPPATQAVLAPIPLTPRRLRIRGYNQAALITHALARRWRMPCVERLLSREKETDSQTALTPEERIRNVAGAFRAAAPPPTPSPRQKGRPPGLCPSPDGRQRGSDSGARRVGRETGGGVAASSRMSASSEMRGDGSTVILVDDVLTTGATVAAAASALEEAGWSQIAAVSFARALAFELRALHG
jgi:predicted amidophosphoribosyltransferase